MSKTIIFIFTAAVFISTSAWAYFCKENLIDFYNGHIYGHNIEALGALAHSGVLNRRGLHNALP